MKSLVSSSEKWGGELANGVPPWIRHCACRVPYRAISGPEMVACMAFQSILVLQLNRVIITSCETIVPTLSTRCCSEEFRNLWGRKACFRGIHLTLLTDSRWL